MFFRARPFPTTATIVFVLGSGPERGGYPSAMDRSPKEIVVFPIGADTDGIFQREVDNGPS